MNKLEFIKRRLFSAMTSGRVPVQFGLTEKQETDRAFEHNLFTPEELQWLRFDEKHDDSFERAVDARITGKRPSVGFVQQALVRVGGIESWIRMLFRQLVDVDVAGLAVTGNESSDTTGIDVPVGFGVEPAAALASRVDVLVVSNEFALDTVMARVTRKPKVVYVHHGDVTCMWSSRAVLNQARLIDALVTVHPESGARFKDVVPRVEYVPNAVDPSRCEPESAEMDRESLFKAVDLPLDAKVVLYAGRFSMDKGYPLARAIGERLPDGVFMVLMGGEPDGSHPKLRFVGRQRRPGNWYNAADMGISTSVEEGCGLSMLEMAYVGLPFVATKRGVAAAHPEMARIMSDGATVSDWVQAIVEDLGDAERVRARVATAKSIAETHYTMERFGASWNRLLVSIAKIS